ncbi:phage baseplate assembly protein V [Serratia marcescens]|uniref:phage baseplate assembly protein V n=1 Tax=Serratia marcescens TaxID=615 RepID=UPI00277825FC|nr:phage baseplate assembly protein V [Serratia marcescens]MDP8742793.1 phage baseplate assembly protein V [Serratia marcescens]HEJ7842174.1 phage baseplate assembly protein V [Serratia marcescens]
MNTDNFDIQRLVRNLIRIGTVSELDLERGRCRIATGGNLTDWLNWLTGRAGDARSWWAPSIGEQVLVLSLGGELETAFVLPGVFSDAHPAPSASAQAAHIAFPDGAVLEYEPATGALKAVGIKSATIEAAKRITLTAPNITCIASGKITLDAPEVECTQQLTTGTIAIHQGGSMTGDLNHTGGSISSNGIVVHTHTHGGVQNGRGRTDKPA